MGAVEVQVELEDVYVRLAQETQLPTFGMCRDKLADVTFGHVAFFGDARHLKIRGGRR